MPASPPPATTKSIGQNIREARQALGLTQLALALHLGLKGDDNSGSSYISKVETGYFEEIKLSTLQRFAEALGVGVDRLLLGKGKGGRK